MKSKILVVLACALALSACDRAPSNVKTMMTTDCGVNWTIIQPGSRVPTSVGACEYKTVLPDYPMQGDTEFLTQFKGNILVKTKIAYDYEIIDGLKFLREAKFLGKASGSAATAAAGTAMSAFETAENVVIDVRIREIVTSKTINADIVEFNPSAFEDVVFAEANKQLADRGVKLNSMTFVTIPEEQTRMAIDAATAVGIYRAKGLEQLGRDLAVARAGATQINIHTQKDSK
jgi:hypothetical protein